MINPNASQLDGQQGIQNVPDNPNNSNGIGKNPKSTFEKTAEAFKKNTAKSMSDVKETHYRAVSEGTQGQGFLGGLWQGIKNIAHNIKAFMSSPMTSAFNIAHEAETLVKTMNTVKHREELIEAFKKNPDEATKMIGELTEQFNGIEKLKSEGKHNGDCGTVLDGAKTFLELAAKTVAECHLEAKNANASARENETAQKEYNGFRFKNTVSAFKSALNVAKDKLAEILEHDPNLTYREKIDNTISTISRTISVAKNGYDLAQDRFVELSKTNPYAKKELQEINDLSKTVDKFLAQIGHR